MQQQTVLIVACMLCLGCQSAGRRQQVAAQPAATEITAQEAGGQQAPSENPERGFSLRRVLQFAGLQQPQEEPRSVVPPEIVQLSDVVNATAARASQLNINDPPEVTRQKAQGILDSLRPWGSLLAAGQSLGLVNADTARVLNGFVGQLKVETQKLVQSGANPQTIAAVQQLAGNLKSTFGSVAAIFAQGTTAYRSLMGSRQQ